MTEAGLDSDVSRWLQIASRSVGDPPPALRNQVLNQIGVIRALAAIDRITPPATLRAEVKTNISTSSTSGEAMLIARTAELPIAASAAAQAFRASPPRRRSLVGRSATAAVALTSVVALGAAVVAAVSGQR